MFSSALALRIEGVWIGRLTKTSPHPLDRWADGIRLRSDDAFRGVYESMVDDLVSFAFGMVSDRRTAEDLVQDSFLELVGAAPKLKGDGLALRAWLYRSVRYGCLDEYRRRARRPETPTDSLPDIPHDFEEPIGFDPDLEAALRQLTKRHRTRVLLRHVVGLSGDEIASVMRTSRKAVYAALNRAQGKLRAALGGAP